MADKRGMEDESNGACGGGDERRAYNEDDAGNAARGSDSGLESHLSAQGACALPPGDSLRTTGSETQPKHVVEDFSQRGDCCQDISLNDRTRRPDPSWQISESNTQSSSSGSSLVTSNSFAHTQQQTSLQMNIPPSVRATPERINNTEIPVAMAEDQLSFQEVPFPVSMPYALPPPENHHSTMPQSTDSSLILSYGSEDNSSVSSNLIASHVRGSAEMSARPVSADGAAAQTPPVSTQLSHSESQISLKSEIPQDCQVRKLPKSLLKFVAVEMDGDSWEDLVELYGWNYDQTRKFASSHPNDVFLALLKVAPFQTYTLSQLRADLERLPRLDLLCDLDEKISGHNTEARGASENQRD